MPVSLGYVFAFSPDGSRLFVVRYVFGVIGFWYWYGMFIFDVLLIVDEELFVLVWLGSLCVVCGIDN